MNLVIERANALSALGRAAGIAQRKGTIAILGNAALTTAEGQLMVRTTDLEMEVTEAISAVVSLPGEITVPVDKLHDIVRNADAGSQVSISLGEGDPRVKVRSGRSNFSLPAMGSGDFPEFRVEGLGEGFAMPAKDLANMLERVLWSVDPADMLTIKGTVYLVTQDIEGKGRELHAVGASSGGVALRRMPAPEGAEIKVILPAKVAGYIAKWLSGAEGDAQISASDRLIQIRHGGSTFNSKLFDVPNYFPYLGRIEEDHEHYAKVAQDELARAVNRVMVMGDGRTGTLHLTFTEGTASIRATNDASGEGVEEIGAEYDGPEARIMIKSSQLMAIIGAMQGDIAEFGFAPVPDSANYKTGLMVLRAPCDTGLIINVMQMRA